MAKKNQKGRTTGERFVMVHSALLCSEAWRTLTPGAAKLYLEVLRRYDGANNGRIILGSRDAARHSGLSKSAVSRAFRELEGLGFLTKTAAHSFSQKQGRACEWRLTWFRCDRTGEPATKQMMRWRPPQSVPPVGQTVPPVGQRPPNCADS